MIRSSYYQQTRYCKVGWCRHSSTHVTKGHKCGRCGRYGHGDAECNNHYAIDALKTYHNEELPKDKYCTVSDCEEKKYHTIDAHHCSICKNRTPHTKADCSDKTSSTQEVENKTYHAKCPICRVDNTLINPSKIFVDAECCICCSNKVEVMFPKCHHCCICFECLEKNLL